MERRIRRSAEDYRECWLHGYHVHIRQGSDVWYVWLIPRGEWTK
jgi:hypothetical protein